MAGNVAEASDTALNGRTYSSPPLVGYSSGGESNEVTTTIIVSVLVDSSVAEPLISVEETKWLTFLA